MDEADKLCDRIAIVDHGDLKALDSPMKLKVSVPSNNVLEVNFTSTPPGWADRLKALPDVEDVTAEDSVFRISSRNGPATTMALLDAAAARRRHGALAGRAKHDARRRVRALHRTGASRRAAGREPAGFRIHDAPLIGGRADVSHLGHRRTRAAPVPPQPDADRHVDGVAARAARHPGLRVRRQRQAPEGRRSSIRTAGCRRCGCASWRGRGRRRRARSTRSSTPIRAARSTTCGTAASTAS